MKDARLIVAINDDEEIPTFRVAGLGRVVDIVTVVPGPSAKLSPTHRRSPF